MQLVKEVYAQVDFSKEASNPLAKFTSIATFVNLILPIMLIFGGLATLSMLLMGAYKYIVSEGNPEKINKAQMTIMYAVIGLLLVVSSFVLTKVIGYILKIDMPL